MNYSVICPACNKRHFYNASQTVQRLDCDECGHRILLTSQPVASPQTTPIKVKKDRKGVYGIVAALLFLSGSGLIVYKWLDQTRQIAYVSDHSSNSSSFETRGSQTKTSDVTGNPSPLLAEPIKSLPEENPKPKPPFEEDSDTPTVEQTPATPEAPSENKMDVPVPNEVVEPKDVVEIPDAGEDVVVNESEPEEITVDIPPQIRNALESISIAKLDSVVKDNMTFRELAQSDADKYVEAWNRSLGDYSIARVSGPAAILTKTIVGIGGRAVLDGESSVRYNSADKSAIEDLQGIGQWPFAAYTEYMGNAIMDYPAFESHLIALKATNGKTFYVSRGLCFRFGMVAIIRSKSSQWSTSKPELQVRKSTGQSPTPNSQPPLKTPQELLGELKAKSPEALELIGDLASSGTVGLKGKSERFIRLAGPNHKVYIQAWNRYIGDDSIARNSSYAKTLTELVVNTGREVLQSGMLKVRFSNQDKTTVERVYELQSWPFIPYSRYMNDAIKKSPGFSLRLFAVTLGDGTIQYVSQGTLFRLGAVEIGQSSDSQWVGSKPRLQ